MNQFLKEIGILAELNDPVLVPSSEGDSKKERTVLKHTLITTHTARRSFCTNAYKQGILVQDIMAISGHKTEKVFLSYIKVDLLENASRISNYGFFS
jgi:hypothetical protein